MNKRTSKHVARAQALAIPLGGMPIPKRARNLAKPAAATGFAEKWKLQMQAARARNKLIPPAAPPKAGPALDEFLAVTNELIERKPPSSKRRPVVGGRLWGSLHFVERPPYVQGLGLVTDGNVKPVGSPDANAGEMSCGATTQFDCASAGTVTTGLEIDYGALFGPSRVTMRPDLEISYGWVLNSLGPEAVAAISVWVEVMKEGSNELVANKSLFDLWPSAVGTLQTDWRTVPNPGWSVEWDVPAPRTVYYIFINAFCGVAGYGWPKSVASAYVNVRVPSVTFDQPLGPQILTVSG